MVLVSAGCCRQRSLTDFQQRSHAGPMQRMENHESLVLAGRERLKSTSKSNCTDMVIGLNRRTKNGLVNGEAVATGEVEVDLVIQPDMTGQRAFHSVRFYSGSLKQSDAPPASAVEAWDCCLRPRRRRCS